MYMSLVMHDSTSIYLLSPIPPQLIPVDIFITESDNVTYIMIQVRCPHRCDMYE